MSRTPVKPAESASPRKVLAWTEYILSKASVGTGKLL